MAAAKKPTVTQRQLAAGLAEKHGMSKKQSNEKKVQEGDGPSYCIRDGIVVIPKDAIIPDGTVI